jgi:hypothetical protein
MAVTIKNDYFCHAVRVNDVHKFFALDCCTGPVAHWNHFAAGSAASPAKLLFACLPCSGMQFFLTPLISTSI